MHSQANEWAILLFGAQERRQLALEKALLRVVELRGQAELVRHKSRAVTVTWDQACAVCQRRLGASAFAVLPKTGALVHLQCQQGAPS